MIIASTGAHTQYNNFLISPELFHQNSFPCVHCKVLDVKPGEQINPFWGYFSNSILKIKKNNIFYVNFVKFMGAGLCPRIQN